MTIIQKNTKQPIDIQRDIRLASLRRGESEKNTQDSTQEDWLSKVKELLMNAEQPKK